MHVENEDDIVVDATLDLPVEGYRQWLEQHSHATSVGYEPSAADNPVARYIYETIGTCNRLHSDGKSAWFMLRLTRSASSDCYLRMVLPSWAAPLVMKYTGYRVGKVSRDPQQHDVERTQALADLRRLVEERQHRTEQKSSS